ncbi:MAG: hypothetical protein LBT38_01895 [Deltaproteobacteria bacterium]|jgi:hypothetical protein|nr:hypothetical protein [Deltaproteobacteria bacterium]
MMSIINMIYIDGLLRSLEKTERALPLLYQGFVERDNGLSYERRQKKETSWLRRWVMVFVVIT